MFLFYWGFCFMPMSIGAIAIAPLQTGLYSNKTILQNAIFT